MDLTDTNTIVITGAVDRIAEELRITNLLLFLVAVKEYGNPNYIDSDIWDEVTDRLGFRPPT